MVVETYPRCSGSNFSCIFSMYGGKMTIAIYPPTRRNPRADIIGIRIPSISIEPSRAPS